MNSLEKNIYRVIERRLHVKQKLAGTRDKPSHSYKQSKNHAKTRKYYAKVFLVMRKSREDEDRNGGD